MKKNLKRDYFGKIRKKLKRFLTENISLKIASILLAAVVWFLIMNVDDPVVTETFSNIPVQILNDEVITAKGFQYSIESGEVIDVRVKGKRSIVDNISETDLVAVADFNSMSSMYLISIEASCPLYTEDELIVTARTENMAIKLEESITQSFGIRIVSTGTVREGYYAFDTSLSTALLQVEGAASQIANIKEIVVEVDIDGRMSSFSVDATPVAYDLEGNVIDPMKLTFSQDTVTVDIGIYPTKEIGVQVNVIGEPAYSFVIGDVNYAPQNVVIAGEQAALDNLETITLDADITGANESVDLQYNLEAVLQEIYSDSIIPIDDDTVIGVVVEIEAMERKDIEMPISALELRGLDENLECTLYSPTAITLRVLGRQGTFENIAASDLKLYVDLSTCTAAGTYSRTIYSDYEGEFIVEPYSAIFSLTWKE